MSERHKPLNTIVKILTCIIPLLTGSFIGYVIGINQNTIIQETEVASENKTLDVYVTVLRSLYEIDVSPKTPFLLVDPLSRRSWILIVDFGDFLKFLKANGVDACFYSYGGKLGSKLWLYHQGDYYYWRAHV